MHKITFYPVGDGDTCLIELECGKILLFDYANFGDPDNDDDLRADLPSELKKKLDSLNVKQFDVVAFTHADDDHIHKSTEFFYLEHNKDYQSDERVKIADLWVPAAMIVDTDDDIPDEAKLLRNEARYRLKNGKGVRVFSRPAKLESWLKSQGLTVKDRESLISDAGQLVPRFSKAAGGVEFFVHSPFAVRNDDELEDKNGRSIILQARFAVDGEDTDFFICGDTDAATLASIVNVTKTHKNEDRLKWDVFDIPHHCSYLALSSEKGKEKTKPIEEIRWLLEDQSQRGGILVSCSSPIPTEDTDQPPHKQAYAYYKGVSESIEGEICVTMEHPKKSKPEPLVIKIKKSGAAKETSILTAGAVTTRTSSPRAG